MQIFRLWAGPTAQETGWDPGHCDLPNCSVPLCINNWELVPAPLPQSSWLSVSAVESENFTFQQIPGGCSGTSLGITVRTDREGGPPLHELAFQVRISQNSPYSVGFFPHLIDWTIDWFSQYRCILWTSFYLFPHDLMANYTRLVGRLLIICWIN